MAATVIPFAGSLVRAGWSSRELAEIYRLADSLAQRGMIVELEMGISDEGDPWLVLSHPGEPDVAAHVARIDGRYLVSRGGLVEEASGSELRELLERAMQGPAVAVAPARVQPDLGEALLTATLLIALGVVARELGPGALSEIAALTPSAGADAMPTPADRWIQLGREAMALLAPVAAPSADPVAPGALAGLPPAADQSAAGDHQPTGLLRQWIEHLIPATASDDPGVPKPHAPPSPAPVHPDGSSIAPDLLTPDAPRGHPTAPTGAAATEDPATPTPPAQTHSLNPGPEPLPAATPAPAAAASPAIGMAGPTLLSDGAGNHTIVGTNHGDIIFATNGNDLIIGGSGNNLIVGGSGHDTIFGGAGNDTLIGGSGAATISGGAGNDLVIGGGKGSVIFGGAGNDLLISGDAVHTGSSVTGTVNQQTVTVSRDATGNVTIQDTSTHTSVLPASPPPPAAHADTTATTVTDTSHTSTEVTLVGVGDLPHNQLHL